MDIGFKATFLAGINLGSFVNVNRGLHETRALYFSRCLVDSLFFHLKTKEWNKFEGIMNGLKEKHNIGACANAPAALKLQVSGWS